jgi:hypothetical protein
MQKAKEGPIDAAQPVRTHGDASTGSVFGLNYQITNLPNYQILEEAQAVSGTTKQNFL